MRELVEGDPRRSHYPFMIVLLVPISVILHLAVPVTLVQFSAERAEPGSPAAVALRAPGRDPLITF